MNMNVENISKEEIEKYPKHRKSWMVRVKADNVDRLEPHYDSIKEWVKDPKGYFVIKVFYDKKEFGARFFTYGNVPQLDIVGTDAEQIVQTIVREGLVTSLQHAAYLGMELHKAEVALKLGLNFVQCDPLDYSKKTSKKESG